MKPTLLTFVNAHLAAFDEMVDKRNSDYRELTRRLRFNAPARHAQPQLDPTLEEPGPMKASQEAVAQPQEKSDEELDEEDEDEDATIETTSVFDSDALFWLVRSSLSLRRRRRNAWLNPRSIYKGDLNYRIDIPDIPLRRILRDGEWDNPDKFETLRRFDQVCTPFTLTALRVIICLNP